MDRWITPEDYNTLYFALKRDQYHTKTKPEFFYESGSFCKAYEDEKGPILFLRGVKSLRVDIQFVDNNDFKRNKKTMVEEFPKFVESCKNAGFKEIVFNTTAPLLKRFCKQELHFDVVEGNELRYFIDAERKLDSESGTKS